MELNLAKPGNAAAGKVTVSDIAFGREFNEDLVHQAIVAYMAGGRQGTRAQKTRTEVNGGGKKPFRQKGSGRARAGSIRSPLWRGGGKSFAAKPQDHSQKINKKMYRAAISSILSELNRQGRLVALEGLTVEAPKTKVLVQRLAELDLDSVLIVTDEVDANLCLSARNLANVDVRDVLGVDPVSLVAFDKVAVTVAALKRFEEILG